MLNRMKIDNDLEQSTSSWKTESFDNDIANYRFNQTIQENRINEGTCRGKYVLTDDKNNTYFCKVFQSNKQYLQEQAFCSAFVSCFSHTPYPIGIKTINNAQYLVWRYDSNDDMFGKEESFYNYNLPQKYDTTTFLSMDERERVVKLAVHNFFFNIRDRKLPNLIFQKNKMIHIDLDEALFSYDDTYDKTNAIIDFLNKVSQQTNNNIIEYRTNTINKILNIDYEKFIKRYMRNCIVLGISKEEAYTYYYNYIYKTILPFFQNHPVLKNRTTENNEWFNTLKQSVINFYNNFTANATLNNMLQQDNFYNTFDRLQSEQQLKYNNNIIKKYITGAFSDRNAVATAIKSCVNTNHTESLQDKHRCFAFSNEDKKSEQVYQTYKRFANDKTDNNLPIVNTELVNLDNIGSINICGIGLC